MVITPGNFMMTQWQKYCEKGVTDRQTDGRIDGQTDRNVLRAAWYHLKTYSTSGNLLQSPTSSQQATRSTCICKTCLYVQNYDIFSSIILQVPYSPGSSQKKSSLDRQWIGNKSLYKPMRQWGISRVSHVYISTSMTIEYKFCALDDLNKNAIDNTTAAVLSTMSMINCIFILKVQTKGDSHSLWRPIYIFYNI